VITEADLQNWIRAPARPYFDQVIESFGFDRPMYASD
jgi:predicted TIM-barrel fold metal-dependent hydrolase